MITRFVHVSAHIFLGGAEVIHCTGVDQLKCALYLLIAGLMIREMWIERQAKHCQMLMPAPDMTNGEKVDVDPAPHK